MVTMPMIDIRPEELRAELDTRDPGHSDAPSDDGDHGHHKRRRRASADAATPHGPWYSSSPVMT